MSAIKISFVIPTFNRGRFLPKAIDSIINQTGINWELIIVDDGSTDETKIIVQQYEKEHKIIYKFQQNQGVSVARNTGISMADGDYIIFLDSDDLFFPPLLSKLISIGFENYDIIFWQVKKEINGKISIWKPKNLGPLYNDICASFLAGSFCIRKKLLKKVGGYDPNMIFGENYELGLRISQLEDLKTITIEKPLMFYSIDTEKRENSALNTRLSSHLHQYCKHEKIYNKSRKAKAEMTYIIGFTYENLDHKDQALKWYNKSLRAFPWGIKPILKIFYLTLVK